MFLSINCNKVIQRDNIIDIKTFWKKIIHFEFLYLSGNKRFHEACITSFRWKYYLWIMVLLMYGFLLFVAYVFVYIKTKSEQKSDNISYISHVRNVYCVTIWWENHATTTVNNIMFLLQWRRPSRGYRPSPRWWPAASRPTRSRKTSVSRRTSPAWTAGRATFSGFRRFSRRILWNFSEHSYTIDTC